MDTAFVAAAVVWIAVSLLTGKTLFLVRTGLPELVSREKEPGAFWGWIGVMGIAIAYFGVRFLGST